MGHDGMQREMTMEEDLDLLSFSGLDSQVHSMQGPPLKTVYRSSETATSTHCAGHFTDVMLSLSGQSCVRMLFNSLRPSGQCARKEHAGPPPLFRHTSASHQASMPPPSAHATCAAGPALALHHQSSQEKPSQKSGISLRVGAQNFPFRRHPTPHHCSRLRLQGGGSTRRLDPCPQCQRCTLANSLPSAGL